MERHTFAAGKIMSLENPFDKMKSREERERERGKKESFLEKVESRFERSSEEIWTKISRYANIKFIETFKINIFPKMITIEFESFFAFPAISRYYRLTRNIVFVIFIPVTSIIYLVAAIAATLRINGYWICFFFLSSIIKRNFGKKNNTENLQFSLPNVN